ncbi:MAG: RNA methyltransferase [Desulfobulbaceae bacterium]|nr:RNA methyltransferase [Desulfobulbaceae bacterium]HIJ78362.1 RNA methyltransferase [Deltaproteobacteria bacterium]
MGQAAHLKVKELLDNVAIVLVAPKYPENVGAAARAAMNMGISQIILVRNELPDDERMRKMATHNAGHIIDKIKRYDSVKEAVAPFGWVVGTSARQGRRRVAFNSPRQVMDELLPLIGNNKVALLFGPEDRGLTNEDLQYCNQITTIPTADFSSLNLAQAVAILCHELHFALLNAVATGYTDFVPKQVESRELEATYDRLEQVLRTIGYLKDTDYEYWMNNIRQFFGRVGLRTKEARVIRGLCKQFIWDRAQQRKTATDA